MGDGGRDEESGNPYEFSNGYQGFKSRMEKYTSNGKGLHR